MTTFPSACLVILDGWGLAPEDDPGNAVAQADTPVMDRLWQEYPHAQLRTSGEDVGLPHGQMGNSEVGHLNLGAGAIVPQDLKRIDDAVEDGSFAKNEVLVAAMQDAPRVHIIGLTSDGGVHSGDAHLRALIRMAAEQGVSDLVIHAFTDGRDTSPHQAVDFLGTVTGWCEEAGAGRIGTIVGRYFAMDRDKRWDRVQKAYDVLVHGRAEYRADSAVEGVRAAYDRDETDEFIEPTVVGDADDGRIRPGDSVIGLNLRPDRMREITRALAEPGFDEVDRGGVEPIERYTMMTEYEEGWPYPIAFPPHRPDATLSHVIAQTGKPQLHVAETEKYPHVTYFFNGGEERPERGERRELVPSPRDVPTYDHKPEMSAAEAAQAFVHGWTSDGPVFGIINFANADMVGHTGSIPAAVKAVQTVDRCLGEIVEAVQQNGGVVVITADHGNADHMLEPDGSPNTAHSLNPVPFVVTSTDVELREEGILADVAPTVLQLLGIDQPPEMTGESMIASS